MDIYEKMKELGVELPAAPAKGGLYSSCKKFGGNLFYVSGCGPVIDGPVTGRLGKEVTVEQGQVYAPRLHAERAGCAGKSGGRSAPA